MGEEDVRIPIILDVEGEGEIDKLHSKLSTLKSKLDALNKDKRGIFNAEKKGQSYAQEIYDAIDAIGRYEKALSTLSGSDMFSEQAKKATDAINLEISRINDFISTHKELRAEFAKSITVDEFSGRISSVKELNDYMQSLSATLDEVNKRFDSGTKSESKDIRVHSMAIQSEIEDINALIKGLGELSAEWSNVQQETDEAGQSFRDTAKFMRQQFGKMFSSGQNFEVGISDSDLKVLAERNEKYNEAIELNKMMQSESTGTANRIVDNINFEIGVLNKLIKKYSELASKVEQSAKGRKRASELEIPSESKESEAEERAKAAEKASNEAEDAIRSQIKSLEEEKAAVKQSTSQYYYKLRALKMLGFTFNNVTSAITKFDRAAISTASRALKAYLKLIPGVSRLQKALSKTGRTQRQFNKELNNTNKSSKKFDFTLKDLIKNILKYGLGIRSLFVLVNKLRQAMMFGFGNMAKQFDSVNESLSSLLTSFTMMKNAVASAVQPLAQLLAPILEKLSALFSELTYKVASFIATLTGQKTVFKAIRYQMDYAESLDKTAKNAKEARKELSGLDKLNVINSDTNNAKSGTPAAMFEEVPIDATIADWAKKLKKFFDDLFAPIKQAWDRVKDYIKTSWNNMWDKIGALVKSVAEDFWRVWTEKKTEDVFAYILLSLGDIMNIIGTIASKIKEAWEYNDNGYRILSSIRDVAYSIAQHFHDITSYTRDWAEREINLKPVTSSIADLLQNRVVPAVNRILDLINSIIKIAILDLIRDFINTNLPELVDGVGFFIDGFGIIAKRIQMALETGTKAGKHIEYTRSRLQQIIDKVEHFSHLISETFKQMGIDFKKWAQELSFKPLTDSFINLLNNLTPLVEALFGKFEWIDGKFQHTDGIINKLWHDTVLPFWEYLIEDGGPKLLDLLAKIFGQYDENTGFGIDWEHLTDVIGRFIDKLEPFLELAWETFLHIIEDLGKAFDDFVNSGALDKIVDKFGEWVDNADPEDLAKKIEHFAEVMLGLTAAFKLFSGIILPVLTNSMTFINFLKQAQMTKEVGTISQEVAKLNGILTGEGAGATAGAGASGGGLNAALSGIVGESKTFVGALKNIGDVASQTATPFSVFSGVLLGVIGIFTSLKGGFDMMEKGFSVGGEALVVFGGIVTTVGGIVAGMGLWPALIVGAITIIVANLGAFGGKMYDALVTGFGDFLNKVSVFFEGLGRDLGVKVGQLLAKLVDAVKELPGKITEWMASVNWAEFGINIVKGILAIFAAPVDLFVLIIDAIASFVDGFIKGLQEGFDMHSPSKLMEPYGENIILGIFEGIKLVDIISWLKTNVVDAFAKTISEGFDSWINDTKEKVSGWVKDRLNDFSQFAKDSGKSFNDMKSDIVKSFGDLKQGASEKAKELVDTARDKFNSVQDKARDNLATDKFVKFGKNAIKGIETGIKAFGTVLSAAASNANQLKSRFSSMLNISTLRSVGVNLINGLKEGLMSALNSALQAITNICNQIVNKAKQAFEVHSPSKVFEDIGKNLMAGLYIGVEDNAEDVSDSFEDLVPSEKMFDTFYDKFIDTMSSVTEDTTNMFDLMFTHIEDSMKKLENMKLMTTMYNNLNNLPKIDTPNVAKGYTLPSNKAFKSEPSDVNLDKLPELMKKALIEAFNETADLQTGEETIILNLDGKKVFETIRNENTKFKKQHGTSAFA